MLTLWLLASRLYLLLDKISTLSKRAVKLGLGEIKVEVLNREIRQHSYHDEVFGLRTVDIEWAFVSISGFMDNVCLNGWKLIGTIEHTWIDGKLYNILRAAPNQTIPEHYRDAKPHCQHCGFDRQRNDTFVLQNELGEYKQVGRNCLADFVRTTNALEIVQYVEDWKACMEVCCSDPDEDFRSGHSRQTPTLLSFLALVVLCIKTWGWISKSKAAELTDAQSTASMAEQCYYDLRNSSLPQHERAKITPTAEHITEAQQAIAWIEGLDYSMLDTEYLRNLWITCHKAALESRDLGIAASLIMAFRKATRPVEPKPEVSASHYIGKVGDKVELEATVERVHECSSLYGVSFLTKMRTSDGNVVTWFASKELPLGPCKVKATIKAHQEYKGEQQTVITRGRVL